MIPKVSVIITIYNREKYIETCIRSLFEQTLPDIEYIIVNDASTDNSILILYRIIEQYPERKSWVKIINLEKNGGVSHARKIGIENVTGEYVIHADSDDWVDHDMYEKLYCNAQQKKADITGCNICHEYEGGTTLLIQHYGNTVDENIGALIRGDIHPSLCTSLTKTKLIRDHQISFPEGLNMGEDLFFNLQLYLHAHLIIGIDDAPYHYRHTTDSSSFHHNRTTINSGINIGKKIEKFMKEENRYEDFKKDIEYRKFSLKMPLIQEFDNIDDYHYWLTVFPETHKHIMSYSQLDWKFRFQLWFAAHHLLFVSQWMKKIISWQHQFKVILKL